MQELHKAGIERGAWRVDVAMPEVVVGALALLAQELLQRAGAATHVFKAKEYELPPHSMLLSSAGEAPGPCPLSCPYEFQQVLKALRYALGWLQRRTNVAPHGCKTNQSQ
jgi:hypothetical protein